MSYSKACYQKVTINIEIKSIINNDTLKLVNLSPINKPLGHKQIFKRKMKAYGTIVKYKSRHFVKGFR